MLDQIVINSRGKVILINDNNIHIQYILQLIKNYDMLIDYPLYQTDK